ncbi:MAG: NAD-dependent epimerase/dehydratase family protein, partial [Limisphaerales bacterium]
DNLRSGSKKNLSGFDCEFIEGSIMNRLTVRRALRDIDFVFHLAAMVSVPESVEKPVVCHEINVVATRTLLEEAVRAGVRKIIFSSSAAIYGDNPTVPKAETMQPEPKSPYASSKLAGEVYCNVFSRRGLPTTCLRYFNVFGPRQDPKSQYAAAVPVFIHRALKNQPITIFGDGEQTRDFIHVKDVVAANFFFAMESPDTGVFNVASGIGISINELVKTVCHLTGSRSEIRYAPGRAGDVKHSRASIEKICAAGFAPAESQQENLRQTIEFFRKLADTRVR